MHECNRALLTGDMFFVSRKCIVTYLFGTLKAFFQLPRFIRKGARVSNGIILKYFGLPENYSKCIES